MTTKMHDSVERNLGEQPFANLMEKTGTTAHDLVQADPKHITYKLVSRARKGRRLTPHSQKQVHNAFEQVSGQTFQLTDLFNYAKPSRKDVSSDR